MLYTFQKVKELTNEKNDSAKLYFLLTIIFLLLFSQNINTLPLKIYQKLLF